MRPALFVLILIGLISLGFTNHSYDINYSNRSLLKVLKKAGLSFEKDIREMPISDTQSSSIPLNGKYFQILTQNENQYQFIYIGRVNSCRSGGCSLSTTEPKDGGSEYFDYFILWDLSKSVKLVKVFNYQATHGHEITAKGWLKQFIGFQEGDILQVDKNVDAISGATISVHAITEDIKSKTSLLQNLDIHKVDNRLSN